MPKQRRYSSEYWKSYYKKNAEKLKEKARKTYHNQTKKQKLERNKKEREQRKNNIADRARQYRNQKKYRQKLKLEIITFYGGKCNCCGISELEFLTIDHIDQSGAEHRKTFTSGGGALYRIIKQENFPLNKYQVLCFNCNFSAYLGQGKCIHTRDL